MPDRRLQIAKVFLFTVLLSPIDLHGAFNGSLGRTFPQPKGSIDACGRQLYNTDGTPLHYRDHCLALSGSALVLGNGPPPSDRFEPPYVAYSTGGSSVQAVSMDDFNQDGKLDMAVSTCGGSDPSRDQRLWIARQDNPSSFSTVYSAVVGAADPQSLDVADMDGDSYLDTVVANSHGGAGNRGDVEVFWGTGYFTFTRTDHTAGANPYAMALMPVYDDYARSLAVTTNWNDVILSSYLGATGYTAIRTDYSAPQAGWNQSATGDLDNDGNQDIAAMWGQLYAAPAFTEYFGDGQGGLSVGPDFPKVNRNPSAIAVGDVTRDGRDDVIIARGGNRPYAEILVYSQDPAGHLSLTASYPSYDMPESLDVADINCDGLNDLIATNAGWFAFSWWPGQPDGSLGMYQIESHSFYFSHVGPNGAELADVDGDGLLDYVVVDLNVDGVLVAIQRPCPWKLYLPAISK